MIMSLSLHSLKRVWFPSMLNEEKKSSSSCADCFSSTETIRGQISTRAGVIACYNPPINFHVILLATLRHVV